MFGELHSASLHVTVLITQTRLEFVASETHSTVLSSNCVFRKSTPGVSSIQGLETRRGRDVSLKICHLGCISGRRVPQYVKASRTPDSEAYRGRD